MQRTPSSILRKRANKENELRDGGKKNKSRSRRVSFAPDDELETMHLYQKGERFSQASPGDDMPNTEDLAARIPLASTMQPINPRANLAYSSSSNAAATKPAGMAGPAASSMQPMSPMVPSPLSSMDLTNNSMDVGFMQQHQQLAAQHGLAMGLQPSGLVLAAASMPSHFEFTTNITSAVPALSTLVEEDEDQQDESCMAEPSTRAMAHGAVSQGQSHAHHTPLRGQDMTVSMDLGGMTPSEHKGLAVTGVDEGSPMDGFLPGNGGGGGASAADILAMSPMSPYVLREMQRGGGSVGGGGGAGGWGLADEDDEDGPGDLKNKWGFTPGVDDTLEMDRGRQVMGETTYNHVYGTSTTGEITRAMQAGQVAAGGAPKPIQPPNRSAIAATANAAAAAAAFHTAHPSVTMGSVSGGEAAVRDGSGPCAPGGVGIAARATAVSVHQTPVQHAPMQAEMTINLLADDLGPGSLWQQPLGRLSAMTGHASVASSKPVRPSLASLDAASHDMTTGGGLGAGGATTALLGGSTTLSVGIAEAVGMRPTAAAAVGRPELGGLQGSGKGSGGAHPQHNYTTQLLADGTATSGGHLQALMQRMQQQQQPGSQGQLGGKVAMGLSRAREGPREDLTSESSAGLMVAAARVMQDGTSGSLDFNLLSGQPGSASLLEDTQHSLGDFAPPPDLHPSILPDTALKSTLLPANSGGTGDAMAAGAGGSTGHRQMLSALPPLPPAIPLQYMQPGRGAVMSAAAVPLPADSPIRVVHTSSNGGSSGGGGGAAAVPVGPPLSFQDFLGLMEIRFLDDMRRRSSFVQPLYGLSLLAPSTSAGGALSGGAGAAAQLPYGEAAEAAYVTGVQSQATAKVLEELAESVEEMQRRAVQVEMDLARNNPPLFRQAQMADDDGVEALRDEMRVLKRSCRQRTLLGWKKTRIAQEQAMVGALRDAATQLDRHLVGLKSVLEEGMQLEQAVEEATALAAQRTQQLQEKAKAQQMAQEHDTLMILRVSEVAAANQRRQEELDRLQQQHENMQDQVRSASEHKASLMHQVKQLKQGQTSQRQQQASQQVEVNVDASATTPPPGGSVRGTNASQRSEASQQSQSLTSGKLGAQAQTALEVKLDVQGLQLDVRPHQAHGNGGGDEATQAKHWSLNIHKHLRLSVQQQEEEDGAEGGQQGMVTVSVQALAGASDLAKSLLPACLGDLSLQTSFPRGMALTHIRKALSSLQALHRLVSELETALVACDPLKRIAVQNTRDDAAHVANPVSKLVLVFMIPGERHVRGRPGRKVEVSMPCGPELLVTGPGGVWGEGEGALEVRTWSPLGVARHHSAARLSARLLMRLASDVGDKCGWWRRVCSAVVDLMEGGGLDAGVWAEEKEEAGPAAMVVSCPQQAQASLPPLISNPLFA